MAIKLTGNYAKRLGLPGYSSHQFSVSVETELTDLTQVQDEAARIYRLLQDAVDCEIQVTGFVPDVEYGLKNTVPLPSSNGRSNGETNGNGHHRLNGGNGNANGNGSGNDNGNGHSNGQANGNGNGNGNHHHRLNGGNSNGNGHSNGHHVRWSCSDKQKELILKLVTENALDRDTVEEISLERFGVGVKQLNKLQASGLIAELLEICGKSDSRQTNGNGRRAAKR